MLLFIFSERQLCSEAVPLLEKCLSEDPVHERALLLLSDCLLTTPTSATTTPTSATTTTTSTPTSSSKKEKNVELKKMAAIESEIKTILEIEEEEEERFLLKMPNGNGANDFLRRKTHNGATKKLLKSHLRTASNVATTSTSSSTQHENEK